MVIDSPVLALDRDFDYRIPERMIGRVAVGSIVRVVLHGRRMRAFVTELLNSSDVEKLRDLSELVSEQPVFDLHGIELARFIARRYVSTVGASLHRFVPGRFSVPPQPSHTASTVNATAPDDLIDVVRARTKAVLISADPDQQIEAIAGAASEAIRLGGRVLVIASRPAAARLLATRLDAVCIHGDQKPVQRAAGWAAARDGSAAIVVGTRSALLVPMANLGLIVVADAHDRTLKDERSPKFHALVVAEQRADLAGAAFIAASPVPPLELAMRSGVRWITCRSSSIRPQVSGHGSNPVTPNMLEVLRTTAEAGKDSIVVIARRGLALRVRCKDCGWYPTCPQCSIGLTMFSAAGGRRMKCRGCNTPASVPSRCPSCGSHDLHAAGWGVERLSDALTDAGVGATVLTVDGDTPLPRRRPSPCVIVGTQAAIWAMHGRTVGAGIVADLDQMLAMPDYRASEKALAMLEDLARLVEPEGRFLVQTREPEHHVVQAFTRRSYRYFYTRELPNRRAVGYPPFGAVIAFQAPADCAQQLQAAATEAGGELIGPLPRPQDRISGLLRGRSVEQFLDPLRNLLVNDARIRIDIDPVDVM